MVRGQAGAKRGEAERMGVHEVYAAVRAVIEPVYLVGGSVRDVVMRRECHDYDFTTPLVPDRIEELVRAAGRKPYLTGKRFGTVGFRVDGHSVEVTTFRAREYLPDERKPRVEFLSDLHDDLARRDFTMNAMALHDSELIDPFGGQSDIASRVIRAVGDPRARFAEDPIRVLRAARFVSELGFSVEPATVEAMRRHPHRILGVARERWMTELDRLLVGDAVGDALHLLADVGLLPFLLPELALQVEYDQNSPYHDRTLFEHTVAVVEATPADVTLRWAALLHDVGKPFVRSERPGRSTYVNHDLLGAEIVARIALSLRWSNVRRGTVTELVRDHMRATSPLKAADDAAKASDRPRPARSEHDAS